MKADQPSATPDFVTYGGNGLASWIMGNPPARDARDLRHGDGIDVGFRKNGPHRREAIRQSASAYKAGMPQREPAPRAPNGPTGLSGATSVTVAVSPAIRRTPAGSGPSAMRTGTR